MFSESKLPADVFGMNLVKEDREVDIQYRDADEKVETVPAHRVPTLIPAPRLESARSVVALAAGLSARSERWFSARLIRCGMAELANTKVLRGISYRLADLQSRAGFALNGFANYLRQQGRANGTRPAIAAVVVGRNDDYMSDFRERLYATLEWNIRYLVDEVVFVEWNPPGDRDLLSYDLVKNFKCLRAYVVPAEVHQQVCQNDNIKLLEYHAKNVGIRRAESPWIMSTNADAAIGLDAVNTVLNGELDSGVAWTAERFDIPWQEDRQQHLRLLGTLRYRRVIPYRHLGTGEFCLASRELWHKVRGYDELMVRHRIGCDQRGTAQMLAHGAEIRRAGTVLHLTHPTSCTETIQPNQGEWATPEGVPYYNDDNWGLGNHQEVQLAEGVWRLE